MDGADGGRGGMIPPPSLFPMRLKIQAGASAEVQKLETKREGETERESERGSESNENENAARRRPAHDNGWVKYLGELMRKGGQVIAGSAGK